MMVDKSDPELILLQHGDHGDESHIINEPFSGIVCGVQVSFHIQCCLNKTFILVLRLRRALERAIPPLSFWKVASFVTTAWVHFQSH